MSSNLTQWNARAGMLGGLLWVLFPLGELPAAGLVLTPQGSLAYYGLGYLAPQLLLVLGLAGLHGLRKRSYGWLGNVGFLVSLAALVIVFIGGTWHMLEITSTGVGSTVSYWTSMMGFFILTWGSGLLGMAITGTLYDLPTYVGGMLLAIAVPLGLLFVFAGGGAWDFGFWVGLTVPYGVAWVLLGYAVLSAKGVAAKRPARVR